MNKIKKVVYCTTVILVIPCLVYYSSKFYYHSSLSFGESSLVGWTIVVTLIIYNMIQTFLLSRKIEKLSKENMGLKDAIMKNHYEDINFQKNTREIIMMEDKGNDERGAVV